MADLSRLKAQLATSGLAQSNPTLYQLLNTLITFLIQTQGVNSTDLTSLQASIVLLQNNLANLEELSFLTDDDESGSLSNSRQLLAGAGITFDDSAPNARTINSSGGTSSEWSVLTDGDAEEPELIFVGGDVIMVHTP